MERINFDVQLRKIVGTGPARAVRKSGSIPAVLYRTQLHSVNSREQQGDLVVDDVYDVEYDAKCKKSGRGGDNRIRLGLPIALNTREFNKTYLKGDIKSKIVVLNFSESTVVNGTVDQNKSVMAVIREIQCHPVTDQVLHIDLQEIDINSKVRIVISVHLLNQEKCIGVKQKGGNINLVKRTIDVMCRPDDIISFIEIDVGDMDLGSAIHIKDLVLPANVTPIDSGDVVVVSVSGHGSGTTTADDGAVAAAVTGGA